MKTTCISIAILGLSFFSSCKKCQDCHYDSDNGEIEIGELCDDDLKDAEANGYNTGDTIVTIHCEEH